jgi:hypothetical protein
MLPSLLFSMMMQASRSARGGNIISSKDHERKMIPLRIAFFESHRVLQSVRFPPFQVLPIQFACSVSVITGSKNVCVTFVLP